MKTRKPIYAYQDENGKIVTTETPPPTINTKATTVTIQECIDALDDYLNAGYKEARTEAAKKAKELYRRFYGTPYKNRNEKE